MLVCGIYQTVEIPPPTCTSSSTFIGISDVCRDWADCGQINADQSTLCTEQRLFVSRAESPMSNSRRVLMVWVEKVRTQRRLVPNCVIMTHISTSTGAARLKRAAQTSLGTSPRPSHAARAQIATRALGFQGAVCPSSYNIFVKTFVFFSPRHQRGGGSGKNRPPIGVDCHALKPFQAKRHCKLFSSQTLSTIQPLKTSKLEAKTPSARSHTPSPHASVKKCTHLSAHENERPLVERRGKKTASER